MLYRTGGIFCYLCSRSDASSLNMCIDDQGEWCKVMVFYQLPWWADPVFAQTRGRACPWAGPPRHSRPRPSDPLTGSCHRATDPPHVAIARGCQEATLTYHFGINYSNLTLHIWQVLYVTITHSRIERAKEIPFHKRALVQFELLLFILLTREAFRPFLSSFWLTRKKIHMASWQMWTKVHE